MIILQLALAGRGPGHFEQLEYANVLLMQVSTALPDIRLIKANCARAAHMMLAKPGLRCAIQLKRTNNTWAYA